MTDIAEEQLYKLPPSAKLIFKALEYADDPLTQQTLVEETLLPSRTVRYGLKRLASLEAIDAQISFKDARQKQYELSTSFTR